MDNRQPELNSQLNREILDELYDGDMDHMAAVFEQFLQTSPPMFAEAEARFKSGDITSFRQQVHKIKPIFSFVGKPDLTELAEAIEKQCHTVSDVTELNTLFLRLSQGHQFLIKIIENEVGSFNH